jgi:hypothetical protein
MRALFGNATLSGFLQPCQLSLYDAYRRTSVQVNDGVPIVDPTMNSRLGRKERVRIRATSLTPGSALARNLAANSSVEHRPRPLGQRRCAPTQCTRPRSLRR